jgi:hypothetical protein
LVRWSCLVLRQLDPASGKKAAAKVVECQAGWLEALAAAGARSEPAQRAVQATLAAHPHLQDEYLQVATALGGCEAAGPSPPHRGGHASTVTLHRRCDATRCDALLFHPRSHRSRCSCLRAGSAPLALAVFSARRASAADAADAAAPLLQLFVDRALAARERPSDHALACYRPLLAAATPDQVATLLLPAAVRAVKRSPEAALASAGFMLGVLGGDLSGASAELAAALLQQARHAKEPVRRLAVRAVCALAARLLDPGAVAAQVSAARALLDGSAEGKIKSPQERASLAAALAALAAAPGRGAADEGVAAAAVDAACALYKEEVTEEVRLALLGALAAWLPRCGALPPAALARLAQGLAEKEALRRGHLRALLPALGASPEARAQAAPLAPALGALAVEGCGKVSARLDGVLALLAAAHVASAAAAADSALQAQGVWAAALAPESPLLAPATAARLAPEDAAAAAELAAVLLTLHAGRLGGEGSPAAAASSRTLALLLLHHAPGVRAAARAAAARVAAAGPGPQAGLLAAVQHWAGAPADVAVLQDPAQGEAPMAQEAVHERYLGALLACLPARGSPAAAALTPGLAAAALLLAHHPMVAAARRGGGGGGSGSATWRAVCGRTGTAAAALASGPQEVVAALVQGPLGASAADPGQRAAAVAALRSAAAAAAPQRWAPLAAALAPLLDCAAHDALTARQLRVYATLPGRVSNENEDGSMIPVELFEALLADAHAVSAPVFPPAAAAAAAAAAAPNGAAPKGARGGKPGGKPAARDAAAEAREAQLAYEAGIRAGVVEVRETLARGLTALGAFAGGNPAFAAAHLSELSAPAAPLLTSPLVGDAAAFACVRQLAACLPGALGWRALDVAAALRLVALAEAVPWLDYERLAGRESVGAAVRAMQRATGGRPATEDYPAVPGSRALAGQVYTFCFPILQAVLRWVGVVCVWWWGTILHSATCPRNVLPGVFFV